MTEKRLNMLLLKMVEPDHGATRDILNDDFYFEGYTTLLLNVAMKKYLFDAVVKKNQQNAEQSKKIFDLILQKTKFKGKDKLILLSILSSGLQDKTFFFNEINNNPLFKQIVDKNADYFSRVVMDKLEIFKENSEETNLKFKHVYDSIKEISDYFDKLNPTPIVNIEKIELIRPTENKKRVFYNLAKIIEERTANGLIHFSIDKEDVLMRIKKLKPILIKKIKNIKFKNPNLYFCNIGCLFNDLWGGTESPDLIDTNILEISKNLDNYLFKPPEKKTYINIPTKGELGVGDEDIYHAIFAINNGELRLAPARIIHDPYNDSILRRKKHTDLFSPSVTTAGAVILKKINNKLHVIAINNGSGHFLPEVASVEANLYVFKEFGFILSNPVKICDYSWNTKKELNTEKKILKFKEKKALII